MPIASIAKPDYRRAESEASRILRAFKVLEPPVDVVKIARESGVKVFFAQFDKAHSDISGFYDFVENAIYVNREEWALRQTFTVAHEFGHKILHEEWAKSEDYKVLMRDGAFQNNDPIEQEANAFAANLLMPRYLMDKYWNRHTVEQLSQLFAVSVPAINFRLSFLYGT